MSTDTNLTSFVINKLTEEEYQQLRTAGEISANELYLTDGEESSGAAWGDITGTLANQTDLIDYIDNIVGDIETLLSQI